jgi:hypothetical protein
MPMRMAAIIFLALYSLANVVSGVGSMGEPVTEEGPPVFISYLEAGFGVVGLIAVFGLWKGKSWGFVLGVVAVVVEALISFGGALFAPDPTIRVVASGFVVVSVVLLILLFMSRSRRALA